ncbi:MAG: SPOR domain-containing protein [Saprospiraceae bacterium]
MVQGGQYASGAMTEDGQRFYFTICNNDAGWDAINTRCEIYVTKKSANGWTAPERLPDYINIKGVNTTHPAVWQRDGQEVLFFASNREGGRGGLDLWYVTRDQGLDNLDFTFPVNLGSVINTLGDEVTPFFDKEEEMLYFASNGHPSIGGLDIFKSKGSETTWVTPINAGLPLNSGADDYGYVRNASGFGGFFTSNRVFGGEKTNTRNDDVFEYTIGGRQITLKANVYAEDSGNLLENVAVSLFQVFDDGGENMLITKDFSSGSYLFELLPNRRFRVEVKRDGYETSGYTFATDSPTTYTYGQPLFLKPNAVATTTSPTTGMGTSTTSQDGIMSENTSAITGSSPTTSGGASTTSSGNLLSSPGEAYTARGTSDKDNLLYSSDAPRYEGTYYRVQLAAVKKFNATHPKFSNMAEYGVMSTEQITDKGLTRVLVGDYFSQEEATLILNAVRKTNKDAYIVQYNDGVRYGRVNF